MNTTRIVLVAGAALGSLGYHAQADTVYDWIPEDDAYYLYEGNWTPQGIPSTLDDIAYFDRGLADDDSPTSVVHFGTDNLSQLIVNNDRIAFYTANLHLGRHDGFPSSLTVAEKMGSDGQLFLQAGVSLDAVYDTIRLNTRQVSIGNGTGSTGLLQVDGAEGDVALISTADLRIGQAGTGTLNVINGARVQGHRLLLGNMGHGSGFATVSNSSLTIGCVSVGSVSADRLFGAIWLTRIPSF